MMIIVMHIYAVAGVMYFGQNVELAHIPEANQFFGTVLRACVSHGVSRSIAFAMMR
jgi:hypothetical protein